MNEILNIDMEIFKGAIYENIIAKSFIKNEIVVVWCKIYNIYTIPLYMSFLNGNQEWMN